MRADAGVRDRVLDEPLHRVAGARGRTGTFRLQLYTGEGRWPVAIATQDAANEGRSLVNGAEDYAGDVWRTHFPQLAAPPLWIQNMIIDRSATLTLVAFTGADDYA